ncbi:MAG TPA: proton-conducting transporter membrane subunit [Candidatus Micrarchaeaceae archaeon]|nr:proton-conducting transporter membrane subunit [Candidatus Micrarchaeaceae archaeon]
MTTPASLLVAGAAVATAGIVVSAVPRGLRAGLAMQAFGVALIGVAGGLVVVGGGDVGSEFRNGLGPTAGIDPLSGFFAAAIAIVSTPALIYAGGYLSTSQNAPAIAAISGVFVLALVGVVLARDAVTFLMMWELMSVAPAVAILLTSRSAETSRAVLIYLGSTHLAGVGVWLSMLALAHIGALTDPHALTVQPALMRSLLAVAALVGFGTKAGLMPLHSWLPRAHPAAPAHVSAVMSGMMIKVALYGLVRMLFFWLAPLPEWVAPVLLAAAALSCVAGVLYALMQHELKRLLAFHSVENVGIIALGLAAALFASAAGQRPLAAIAFAAAMLHTLNHALFKSLLFLCAGSFQKQVGKLDLDRLGGLLRTMPLTGTAFLAGSMAIAGVPPFNGFASEWLTFQALVQLALQGASTDAAMGALAAAALAATAALAVFCFVKVVGLVLLGAHRQKAVASSHEVPVSMTGPVIFLAGLCLGIGVVPGVVLGPIGHVSPYGPLPASLVGATLAVPGSGAFAPLALIAVIVVCTAGLQLARRQAGTTAPSPMWICGQVPDSRLAWTSAGFTKSLRLVLAVVLRPRRTVSIELDGALVHSVVHESEVPHLFDEVLFRPALGRVLAASRILRRTQSGSLRAYLTYLLVTLAIVLAVVRLGLS